MLTRQEQEIMGAVYALCNGKRSSLVTPADLLRHLPPKCKLSEEGLEKLLLSVKAEDYFDLILSDRKGERMYVIHLRPKGMNFPHERRKQQKQLFVRICFTVGGAILSFFIGLLLRRIFS